MQLTTEQIQNLYAFTKKHNVEWYDLQTELIDHLASDIENIWQKEPSLTFEQARYKAIIKFGVKGFSKFVNEREKSLTKKYNKLNLKYFIAYFKLPKLLFTLSLVAILFLILSKVDNYSLATQIVSWLIYFPFTGYLVFDAYKVKRVEKITGKKWLFEQNNSNLRFITIVLLSAGIFPYLFPKKSIQSPNFQEAMLTSLFFITTSIATYIALVFVPKKIRAEASKNFTQYKI